MQGTILVGTAGQGILRSADNGATWHRLGLKEAIEFDGVVRCLGVDPNDPAKVYAGADCGLCLSEDGGAHFRRIESPMNGKTVWALAIDHTDSNIIYAGTGAPSRAVMYRTKDGGASWTALSPEIPEFCGGVNRPRILTICIDPVDTAQVWFGVEEGGAWRSSDQGDTWTREDNPDSGITNHDIHGITIIPATPLGEKSTMVLSVNTVYTSTDNGESWQGVPSRSRFDGMYYTRTVVSLPGSPDKLLIAIGDGTPGTRTKIYRSVDRGAEWNETVMHTPPNSTFWAFGQHHANSDLIFAGTKYGHLFRSNDGGGNWYKEWRDFSEITSVAWTPYAAVIRAHPKSID